MANIRIAHRRRIWNDSQKLSQQFNPIEYLNALCTNKPLLIVHNSSKKRFKFHLCISILNAISLLHAMNPVIRTQWQKRELILNELDYCWH